MRSVRYFLLLTVLLCAGSWGQDQERVRASVKFQKFDFNSVPTPVYKATSNPAASREHEWFQVYVEYTVLGGDDGWLDELQLQWSVLVQDEQGRYLLMHAEASYLDVETEGKQHRAVVYIRPSVALRYCGKERIPKSSVWVHVEALVDGRVIEKEDYGRARPPAANWWQAKNNRTVKVLEGALLTRDKTPFAPLDYDFYEHLKGTPGR